MNKEVLYKKYLSIWQLSGDYKRRKESLSFAKNNTKELLPESLANKAIDFYKPYTKIDTIFHSFYTEKTGIFDEKYLPDDIYYSKIDTYYNDWNAAKVVDNKCYYENLFSPVRGEVKHPETFIRRINGIWLDCGWNIIDFETVLESIRRKSFFLKIARQSEGGKGVFYFDSRSLSFYDDFNMVVSNTSKDLVIQKPLQQSNILSSINRSSVNTIRMISLLRNGEVKVYSSILRMGVNDAKVDNASSGGITCGIDDNGCLKKLAYSANGERYDVHPSSKTVFEGLKIPGYEKAMHMIKMCHPIIPDFRLVSWDIAIDENGDPVLIEVNLKYGELDFHQLNNGPLFGEDTREILEEVFERTNRNKK